MVDIPDPKNRNPVKFPMSKMAAEILFDTSWNQWISFSQHDQAFGHIHDARGVFFENLWGGRCACNSPRYEADLSGDSGECDIELWKTKLLMGHKLNQDVTISHYTETEDLTYLEPEINKIGDWITRQGIIAKSDKVVPFPARAKGGTKWA